VGDRANPKKRKKPQPGSGFLTGATHEAASHTGKTKPNCKKGRLFARMMYGISHIGGNLPGPKNGREKI